MDWVPVVILGLIAFAITGVIWQSFWNKNRGP